MAHLKEKLNLILMIYLKWNVAPIKKHVHEKTFNVVYWYILLHCTCEIKYMLSIEEFESTGRKCRNHDDVISWEYFPR